jgi:Protein of unknown function (DUF1761)
MLAINYLAVVAAAAAAFVASSVYYIVFGRERLKLLGNDPAAKADMRRTQPWKMLTEVLRGLVVAYVLARLIVLAGVVDWSGAVQLAVWLWVGFPLMILLGSVLWDKRPWKLAAIHAGDWLLKILLIAAILGMWR